MPLEGLWTKVAQLNKFGVPDFDLASQDKFEDSGCIKLYDLKVTIFHIYDRY